MSPRTNKFANNVAKSDAIWEHLGAIFGTVARLFSVAFSGTLPEVFLETFGSEKAPKMEALGSVFEAFWVTGGNVNFRDPYLEKANFLRQQGLIITALGAPFGHLLAKRSPESNFVGFWFDFGLLQTSGSINRNV